jgi:hypothetical protein
VILAADVLHAYDAKASKYGKKITSAVPRLFLTSYNYEFK